VFRQVIRRGGGTVGGKAAGDGNTHNHKKAAKRQREHGEQRE